VVEVRATLTAAMGGWSEIDTNELESADWFTRDEVKAALEAPTPRLGVPPPLAIAHHLIRAWVAE
jgi:NAD+ diphosphatase